MDQKKPVLVAMAAGAGSRFGGPKQLTPVDSEGRCLVEYACADARNAGFETVVFIIREEHEAEFEKGISRRVREDLGMKVRYAYQKLDDLPDGFTVPEGRVKPWGTTHAVLCASDAADGAPVLIINADDYYGSEPYALMYKFLSEESRADLHAMAGYRIGDTLSESGGVTRGICVAKNGELAGIVETQGIVRREDGFVAALEGEGDVLPEDAVASMNMWAFGADFLKKMQGEFDAFLRDTVPGNPLKGECLLPDVVGNMVKAGKARVRVLPVSAQWYGMTYAQDLPLLEKALARMGAWKGRKQ